MNLSRLVLALALVVPLAAVAQSAQDPHGFNKRFQAADVDKNGKLTRAEAYAAFPLMPQYFDEIDVNRDGSITMIEVEGFPCSFFDFQVLPKRRRLPKMVER